MTSITRSWTWPSSASTDLYGHNDLSFEIPLELNVAMRFTQTITVLERYIEMRNNPVVMHQIGLNERTVVDSRRRACTEETDEQAHFTAARDPWASGRGQGDAVYHFCKAALLDGVAGALAL